MARTSTPIDWAQARSATHERGGQYDRAAAIYIKSLKSQHNALVVSLEDLSSVSRASRWIDSAKGRLKEES